MQGNSLGKRQAAAVLAIADHRSLLRCPLHTDLMLAARFQLDANERQAAAGGQHAIMEPSLLSTWRVSVCRMHSAMPLIFT